MNLFRTPSLPRVLSLAATTTVITLLCLYGVFMETDYGKALFFTYNEVWASAERQEAAGNRREAERLIRHIIVMEEDRVSMKFGLFVLFAGPDYLVSAKLKLAKMYWDQHCLNEADETYRSAVDTVLDISGPETWTYPVAEFGYAEFLSGTGHRVEAAQHLNEARRCAEAILVKHYWPWQDYEGAGVPIVRKLMDRILALQAELARTGTLQ